MRERTTEPLSKRCIVKCWMYRLVFTSDITLGNRMLAAAKVSLIVLGIGSAALAWGYWYSAFHYALNIRIEDFGLKTEQQAYGSPHAVSLTYFGDEGTVLAYAHSVEPVGYFVPIHPDPKISDCRQFENDQGKYADCYDLRSAWVSGWATRVRRATVKTGTCYIQQVPVGVYESGNKWWLWWVPHPHIGGTPRRFIELTAKINSQTCTAVEFHERAGRL